jgi:hypothetical protein
MVVTSSNPIVSGDRTLLAADGTHGPATGWWGAVRNNDASALPSRVSVICAK